MIAIMNEEVAKYLVRVGIHLYNRHIFIRYYDDVQMEEYNEYLKYMEFMDPLQQSTWSTWALPGVHGLYLELVDPLQQSTKRSVTVENDKDQESKDNLHV